MKAFAGINQWEKWRSRMDFYYYFGTLLLGGLFTGYFATEYKYIIIVTIPSAQPVQISSRSDYCITLS